MAAIEVRNLHKTYRDLVAVDDVSFDVEQGEIFGILGPNGAGKTTTVAADSEPTARRRHIGTARGLAREGLSEARRSV